MKKISTLITILLFTSCTLVQKQQSTDAPIPGSLEDAVEASARAPENKERDEFQHPKETLEFFGIKSTMTVVEIAPGAGYYTEILAPFLAREGQYVMAVPRMPSRAPRFMKENEKKLQDILLQNREVQAKTKLIPFEPRDKRNKVQKDWADMVVTFNNVHTFIAKKTQKESFKFFYDILKKGGTLGIVQHRIAESQKKIPKSGYMTESEVIALAKRAGFKFVSKSEINANPKDRANYPEGVWVLPPTYRLGEKDHDKYEDIGESNRMTLRFVK